MTQPPDPSVYLRQIQEGVRGYIDPPPPQPPGGAGQGDGDDKMEQRLRAIEDRLLTFETKSATFATKEDVRAVEATVARIEGAVHRELHQQTWKLVGVVVALFAGAFALAKLMHP